jgi:hypothetical protein
MYLDTLEHCRDEGLHCGVEGHGISVFGIREGWVFMAFVFVQVLQAESLVLALSHFCTDHEVLHVSIQVTLVITLIRLSMIAKMTRAKAKHHDASALVINEHLAGFV